MNEVLSLFSATQESVAQSDISQGKGLVAIGAGVAMLGATSVGVGQGIGVGRACEAIGRNPEANKLIKTNMIIGLAIAETSAIYSLVISLILIFAYK